MAVGEQNVGRSLGRLCGVAGEFRVAAEKRVDQNNRRAELDAESRVAEPNQVHGGPIQSEHQAGGEERTHTPLIIREIYIYKPAFAGWRAIFQRFWSDSSIMISALCWIDRGGHGEPGG